MAEIDDKDLQAFEELQRRVIDLTEKQKLTQQQISANSQHLKRSVLTASQLDKLSDETLMFEAAGKAYFLTPRSKLLQGLQETTQAVSDTLKRLKENKSNLDKGLQTVEEEAKELLQNAPALARAISGQS